MDAATVQREGAESYFDYHVFLVAETLLEKSMPSEALGLLEKALSDTPSLQPWRYRLAAGCSVKLRKFEAARAEMKRGLAALSALESLPEAERENISPDNMLKFRVDLDLVHFSIEALLGRTGEAQTFFNERLKPHIHKPWGINIRLAELDFLMANSAWDKALLRTEEVPVEYAERVSFYRLKALLNSDGLEAVAELDALGIDLEVDKLPKGFEKTDEAVGPRIRILCRWAEQAVRRRDVEAAWRLLDHAEQLSASVERALSYPAFRAALRVEALLRMPVESDADQVARRGGLERALDILLSELKGRRASLRASGESAQGFGPLHFDANGTAIVAAIGALLELAEDPLDGAENAWAEVLQWQGLVARPGVVDPTVAGVRERLGADHGAIVWVTGSLGTVFLALDAEGCMVSRFEVAGATVRDQLVEVQGRLRRAVRKSRFVGRADASVAELRDLVLPAEAMDWIAQHRRLSVSSTSLGWLPFERFRNEDGELLGVAHAVHHEASLAHKREPEPQRDGRESLAVALIASLRGDEDTLKDSIPRQLREHAAQVGTCTGFFDGSASPSSLSEPSVRAADVLHLVGHGVYEQALTPRTTVRLQLGLGGAVGVEDLPEDLSARLVVISACAVGDADLRRGDDALSASLAGEFLRRGARCVVVAMTDVESGPHFELMQVFYRELARGVRASAAMATARKATAADASSEGLQATMVQVHGDF